MINSFRECQIFANDSIMLDFITPCHALRGVNRSAINKRLIFGREEYYSKLNWASLSRSQTQDSGQLTARYLEWKVNNLLKGLNELDTGFSNIRRMGNCHMASDREAVVVSGKVLFRCIDRNSLQILSDLESYNWALLCVFSVFLIAFNRNLRLKWCFSLPNNWKMQTEVFYIRE